MFDLLAGLKVVDLTTIALGPYATQMLGDFGAQVIKVEAPEGDLFRSVRPGRQPDLGVAFQNFNRNKRSIVIDLKQARGREALRALVASADVFVHNMREGSAADLGVSYDDLRAVNERLVYCFAPGFGSEGPDRDAPAYDDIIQARSGLAALNADDAGNPRFVPTIACDKIVGLHLAVAVLSGVVSRLRNGRGVQIEVPMLESMTSFVMAEHLAGHSLVPPVGELGYSRMLSQHRRPYRTLDGYLAIMPYSTRHWQRFFLACGRADLAEDERVLDSELRSEHIDALYQEVAALAATRTTQEWLLLLEPEDVPCSRVNDLAGLFEDPHLSAVGLFEQVESAERGPLQQIRSPFRIRGEDQLEGLPAPRLGEHSVQILEEAGLPEEEITALVAEDVVITGG